MKRVIELLMVLALGVLVQGEFCTSQRPSSVKFSLKSEKNSTGNWNAQLQFQHAVLPNQPGPWEVDMEQITDKCKELEYITIVANISGPATTLPKHEHKLGPGYEFIPGLGYYKLHPEVKIWSEARGICEQEGAHLLIINSDREANALLHFWTPYPKIGGYTDWRNDWALIGFHDQFVEGEYVTIFGKY
ncbi:Hemolymph lipopolysaccharide-binding protein [Blattella germanica]|nr:Hemolymph lipopolysaccharide-binding protein [Blattella germanica]